MRRDFGNELVVAIAAIALIVFAISFGILLSISDAANNTRTPTPAEVAPAVVEANVASGVPTVTPIATRTPSLTPTITHTASMTATASPTPTASSTPSPTPSPSPSVTFTATVTLLPTSVATVTATASPTLALTHTRIPSATVTHTSLPQPTLPQSREAASEAVASSATPTVTATSPNIPTRTAVATDNEIGVIFTPTPGPTSFVGGVETGAVSESGCAILPGWQSYTVRSGDTLTAIARTYNSTVDALQAGNCLEDADTLRVGQILYVPGSEPSPTAPALVGVDDRDAVGCDSPVAKINYPAANQTLSGMVEVRGTAITEGFAYYQLEISGADVDNFRLVTESTIPAFEGTLGRINGTLFSSGAFWLRLRVFNTHDEVVQNGICTIPIRFQ